MTDIVVIAHNLRSSHNVGSLLRTAEGLGVKHVFLTGYTPYPQVENDQRLPHVIEHATKQIYKTALNAENLLKIEHSDNVFDVLGQLKTRGYQIASLEQSPSSVNLSAFELPPRLALLVGREVEGVEAEVLERSDVILEIPMRGKKESFNVTEAAAMALFYLTHIA